MADQLKVKIDTRAGRASLVYGRPFVGGIYDLEVETDGNADTTRLVRIYRFDLARRIKWALAEAKGGGKFYLDSEDFRRAFQTVAPSRALPCEFIVYDDDAIVAQGNVTIEWSPTLTTVDGKPVDVQGPPGEKGDKGEQGPKGDDGKSAYQGAVEQGYQGTEKEFYASLCSLQDLVNAAATSARAAAVSAETAAAETLVGAQQLTDAVKAKDAAEDAAKRAEAAVEKVASASDIAAKAEKAAQDALNAAEQIGDVSAHIADHNNPHQVTAEQVPCGTTSSAIAVIDGADNWGTAWGFDLDLRSINPDVWEGRADGTVAQVTTVGLQVSGSPGKNIQAKLELTGTDGKVWTSTNAASWRGSGLAVDYTFDPPATLPDGVMSARFLTVAGQAVAVPLRISKVSATETPAGCDVWTASGGASKRTDFAPRVRETQYTLPPQSVAEAIQNISLTPGPQGPQGEPGPQGPKGDPGDPAALPVATADTLGGVKVGAGLTAAADGTLSADIAAGDVAKTIADNDFSGTNLFRGIARMANPRVSAAPDDATKDIAIVPNADGAGLQLQFPGGATSMIRAKTGTLATVQEVNEAIKNKQDKLVAGSGISIAEDGKTISATGGGGGTGVTIDTTMPSAPTDDHVPSTKLLKETANNVVKNGFIEYDVYSFYAFFGYLEGQGGGKDFGFFVSREDENCITLMMGGNQSSSNSRVLTTKAYVDGLVGDINAALAQI